MASFLQQPDGIHLHIEQPNSIPEKYPIRNAVQIELSISFCRLILRHYCSINRFTESSTDFPQQTLRFNIRVLEHPKQGYEIIADMLSRFPLPPTSLVLGAVVEKIVRYGVRIQKLDSNKGREVLPLRVDIVEKVTQHVNTEPERVLLRRAVAESALLRNNVMVPAKESSVKKMLKQVRVEDEGDQVSKKRRVKGQDCVICLEEMEVGSEASEMPCSHTFHSHCIQKWLKESHFCPLCRFEMPI